MRKDDAFRLISEEAAGALALLLLAAMMLLDSLGAFA